MLSPPITKILSTIVEIYFKICPTPVDVSPIDVKPLFDKNGILLLFDFSNTVKDSFS